MDCSAICVVDHELTRKQIYVSLPKRPCGQSAVCPYQTSKQNIKSNHTLWEENVEFTNQLQHLTQVWISQPTTNIQLVIWMQALFCRNVLLCHFFHINMNCDSSQNIALFFLPFSIFPPFLLALRPTHQSCQSGSFTTSFAVLSFPAIFVSVRFKELQKNQANHTIY